MLYKSWEEFKEITLRRHEENTLKFKPIIDQSRLKSTTLTEMEENCFKDLKKGSADLKIYLFIRNLIVKKWIENPAEEVQLKTIWDEISIQNNPPILVNLSKKVFNFLNRHGFVNFGIYKILDWQPLSKNKIVVIGAGISGLVCARKLVSLGFQVVLLEAKDCVGGRVRTHFTSEYRHADLGGMIMLGEGGNPMKLLTRQINAEILFLTESCPLFDFDGTPVTEEDDSEVEALYNQILEISANFFREFKCKKWGLGTVMETVLTLMELQGHQQRLLNLKKILKITSQIHQITIQLIELRNSLRETHKKLESVVKHCQFDREFLERYLQFELSKSCAKFDHLFSRREQLGDLLKAARPGLAEEPEMSPAKRRLLDWHLSNMEFGNSCPVESLSGLYWDQDDGNEYPGKHFTLVNGLSPIIDALADSLKDKIILNSEVSLISYDENGVEISYQSREGTAKLSADAVVCTVSLGILKSSVKNSGLIFRPPLPKSKRLAIKRLNFGVMNKVVMFFAEPFWDIDSNAIGHLSDSRKSRGEFFQFWNFGNQSTIIAFVSGAAAEYVEKMDDPEVVAKCLGVLRRIFHQKIIPPPQSYVVTRWKSDRHIGGSYSSVGVKGSGDDYDVISHPLSGSFSIANDKNGGHVGVQRVFFAGEHTIANYPATLHGALLSGLREAGRIADNFFGVL